VLPPWSSRRHQLRSTFSATRLAPAFEVQGRFAAPRSLSFEQFEQYLPVGARSIAVWPMVRLYAGATFDFDIQPVLEGSGPGANLARAPRSRLAGTPGFTLSLHLSVTPSSASPTKSR
jgi:hypothetical protein